MATAFHTPEAPGARPPGAPSPSWFRVVLGTPFTGRAARELLYVLSGVPIALISFACAFTVLGSGTLLLVTFLGVFVLAGGLAGFRLLGHLERGRARALLGHAVPDPEPVHAIQRASGPMAWLRAVLRSGVSWRHLLYSLVHLPWALISLAAVGLVGMNGWLLLLYPFWRLTVLGEPHVLQLSPSGLQIGGSGAEGAWTPGTAAESLLVGAIGLPLVLITPWLVRGLVQGDKLLVSGLLGPSKLATRVQELESDRGVVVDTAAADLRRIERDLHDGAQARLVALAMDLGLAKEKLLEDPQAAAHMVDEAHGEVKLALQELRDLARGIHPAILTDRGLGPALSAVAARCTTPVTLTIDLPTRPAPAIEGIAYFTVSELLQNISKHAHATQAHIDIWHTDTRFLLQVHDNGSGGASAQPGTGLAGLAERLDSVDGLLVLDSPTGGPTTITAELPWR